MAKGKHSTALFEVINRDKRFARPAGTTGRGLLAWLTGARAGSATRGLGGMAAPPPPPPALAPPPSAASAPASPLPVPVNYGRGPAEPRVQLVVDSQRRQIAVRMSYTSAVVTAFGIAAVLGLAYVVGQHMRQGPAGALAGPAGDVTRLPLQRGVLDVPPGGTAARPAGPRAVSSAPAARQEPGRIVNEPRPPATHTWLDSRRIIGLNYVIVQSYKDEKSANDAKETLNQHDILCTVEKDLPGWGKGWYSVVGVVGFERIRNVPELDQYVKAIMAVSNKFATSNPKFNRFNPMPYKWKG